MRVGVQQPWLECCRIVAAGLNAGGVREPSDGWGSPPPEHRAWASVVSMSAGAPSILPSMTVGSHPERSSSSGGGNSSSRTTGNGGRGGGGSGSREPSSTPASPSLSFREKKDGSKNNGENEGAGLPPSYLICLAPPDIHAESASTTAPSESGSYGQGRTRGGDGGDHRRGRSGDARGRNDRSDQATEAKFLNVKASGRADSAGGTGSSASVVMTVGQVEAWALGGAAARWWARLGPKVRCHHVAFFWFGLWRGGVAWFVRAGM